MISAALQTVIQDRLFPIQRCTGIGIIGSKETIANSQSIVSRDSWASLPIALQDLVNYLYKKVFIVGAAGE